LCTLSNIYAMDDKRIVASGLFVLGTNSRS